MVKAVAQAPNLDDIASFTVSGAAGEFVYQEGDPGKDMYIIQEGRIEILNQYAGELRQLDVLESGDFFGELSLLEDQRRDAAARAATPYRLLRIDRTTLHQLVQENPEIAVRMLHRLASRLREHEEARLRASEIAAAAMSPMPNARAPQVPLPPTAEKMAKPAGARESAAPQAAAAPVAVAAARTAVLVHAGTGQEFPLSDRGELFVGRTDRATGFTPGIDLTPVDDKRTLSRRHAKIAERGGRFYVWEETATRNGTFVNGSRISTGSEAELKDGDKVKFGLVETVFRYK